MARSRTSLPRLNIQKSNIEQLMVAYSFSLPGLLLASDAPFLVDYSDGSKAIIAQSHYTPRGPNAARHRLRVSLFPEEDDRFAAVIEYSSAEDGGTEGPRWRGQPMSRVEEVLAQAEGRGEAFCRVEMEFVRSTVEHLWFPLPTPFSDPVAPDGVLEIRGIRGVAVAAGEAGSQSRYNFILDQPGEDAVSLSLAFRLPEPDGVLLPSSAVKRSLEISGILVQLERERG